MAEEAALCRGYVVKKAVKGFEQTFFTRNALAHITEVTLTNITNFQQDVPSGNVVTLDLLQK